jgi:hypothetical protein
MPRSIAGALAILNEEFRGFSQSIEENSRVKPCFFLQALNISSFMNHELITTDVAFGVSHMVAAVTGHPVGCRLSM